MEEITGITILIALITGIVCTIIVIVDSHRYWNKIIKSKRIGEKKNEKRI